MHVLLLYATSAHLGARVAGNLTPLCYRCVVVTTFRLRKAPDQAYRDERLRRLKGVSGASVGVGGTGDDARVVRQVSVRCSHETFGAVARTDRSMYSRTT